MTSTMTKLQNEPSPQHPGSDGERGWKNYLDVLQRFWQPYLDGRATFSDAIARMVSSL